MLKNSSIYLSTSINNSIKKENYPEKIEPDFSKNETSCLTLKDQKFSSFNSSFSNKINIPLFSPNLNNFLSNNFQPKSNLDKYCPFTKKNIILSFDNQNSTKQLQKSIVGASKETIDFIINQLKGSFRMIIKDKNGNYFCSDLIKLCDKNQRIQILNELSYSLCEDSNDEFGTHSIQSLIECSSSEEEYKLLLSPFNDFNKIILTSLNQYGTYVIQKLIVNIPENFRTQFNLIFVKFICILSRDMYGVCAVKKFIGYTSNEFIVKQFLNIILTNFVNISTNKFGNYLIQYLLEKWWKKEEGLYIKNIIFSKFRILSENHYSSYICGLFIKLCNSKEKKMLSYFVNDSNLGKKNNNKKKFPINIEENKNDSNNNNKELNNNNKDNNEK